MALQALKRKKRVENQLGHLDNTLTALEMQREALENAGSRKEVFDTMQAASTAISSVHAQFDLDKLYELKQEMTEQAELAEEISSAISSPLGSVVDDLDEEDLLRELEQLERKNAKLEDSEIKGSPKAPTAVEPIAKKKGEKKSLVSV